MRKFFGEHTAKSNLPIFKLMKRYQGNVAQLIACHGWISTAIFSNARTPLHRPRPYLGHMAEVIQRYTYTYTLSFLICKSVSRESVNCVQLRAARSQLADVCP